MVCIPTLSPGPKLPWKKSLYHQLQFLDTWPPTTWHMSEKSLQPTRVGAFFQLQIFTTPDLARRASPLSPWVPPACQPAACLEGRPESRTLCEKSSGTTNGFGALRPCGQKAGSSVFPGSVHRSCSLEPKKEVPGVWMRMEGVQALNDPKRYVRVVFGFIASSPSLQILRRFAFCEMFQILPHTLWLSWNPASYSRSFSPNMTNMSLWLIFGAFLRVRVLAL